MYNLTSFPSIMAAVWDIFIFLIFSRYKPIKSHSFMTVSAAGNVLFQRFSFWFIRVRPVSLSLSLSLSLIPFIPTTSLWTSSSETGTTSMIYHSLGSTLKMRGVRNRPNNWQCLYRFCTKCHDGATIQCSTLSFYLFYIFIDVVLLLACQKLTYSSQYQCILR